jgi:hypothetical protein
MKTNSFRFLVELSSTVLRNGDCIKGRTTMTARLTQGFVAFAFLVLVAATAQAKDLSHRLGIGYKNQSSANIPSLALQYYPGAELGLSAVLGIDTEKNNSRFSAMAKLNRVIFQEDNLNFYMGVGAGLLSTEVATNIESGFELMGYGGAEFFFAGLENLGFSFEAGIAVASISSEVRFRTFGDHPLCAGMTFYF